MGPVRNNGVVTPAPTTETTTTPNVSTVPGRVAQVMARPEGRDLVQNVVRDNRIAVLCIQFLVVDQLKTRIERNVESLRRSSGG